MPRLGRKKVTKMRFRLTKNERNWVLYDVGNSAFVLLVSTIMPIYFNYLAGNAGLSSADYMAYWGYAASIVTIIVAVLGPVMGTLADTKDFKKPVFTISMLAGAAGCICLGLARQWVMFIIIYIIAKTGFSCSLIFYDSMLTDITVDERMDNVSSHGFAWGYIGSCIPFAACLVLVLGAGRIGISMETAMTVTFAVTAVWWIAMTIPLLKTYRQKYYAEKKKNAVKDSFARLGNTFKNVKQNKKVFVFLLAFFFYIDGVYTIIDMATAYGQALGLDSTGLLMALLVTQIVAFPCSIAFGRLSQKIKSERLIIVCITAYFGIAIFAMFLHTQAQFWILAIVVGMFQGGIQALSRSYFTKIIPAGQSGEYFGLMDICGKGASFMGTTIVSVVSQMTGNVSKGVGMIAVLFVAGMVFFIYSLRVEPEKKEQREELIKSKLAVTEEY